MAEKYCFARLRGAAALSAPPPGSYAYGGPSIILSAADETAAAASTISATSKWCGDWDAHVTSRHDTNWHHVCVWRHTHVTSLGNAAVATGHRNVSHACNLFTVMFALKYILTRLS